MIPSQLCLRDPKTYHIKLLMFLNSSLEILETSSRQTLLIQEVQKFSLVQF